MLAADTPDLVLIDADVPDADGISLCREMLHRAGESPDSGPAFSVVVVVPADRARSDDLTRAVAAGADAGLMEPDDPGAFLAAIGAILTRRDGLQQLLAERGALRERDARHRVLAATLGEMVYDWDLMTDTVEWNDAMIRKLRYQPGQVGPTSQWWLDRVHADDQPAVVRALHRAFTERADWFEAEYRFAYADSGYAVVVDSATILYDQQRPVRVVGIMKDVTDRRQLEEQLRTAQRMEAIGQLAGGIAHDFNNVLTAILGFALLLKEALKPRPELAEHAAEIEAAATSAAALTRQLLAFSRRQLLRPEVLSLNAVVTSSTRLIERLIGEHIRIELALDERVPRVLVDRSQLEQVIVNLAVNARDAMTGGGTLRFATGMVSVSGADADTRGWAPGTYVHLAVSDTGVGMDDATRAKVFEPFFTTKQLGHGTGLGLATVYGSVTQVGGYITVTSAPRKGATFDVYLPATSDAPAARPATQARAVRTPEFAPSETILVVEDEPSVRSLIERVLTGAGYAVVMAPDGRTALQTAAAHAGPLHLLLTDVVLPGLSGFAVARKLQRKIPGLRVLYMSGYSEEMHGSPVRKLTPRRLLQKPFSPGLLLEYVRLALDEPPEGAGGSVA